jgi:prepilin-type N-terminal cleavage/methylation domain-containing protein
MGTRRGGFTLVEMLAVVGIMAVLASLVATSLNRVSGSARQAKCVSNLRQIGVAVHLFAAENEDSFPRSASYTTEDANGKNTGIWVNDLGPYVTRSVPKVGAGLQKADPASVFTCPEAKPLKSWNGSAPDYGCNRRMQDSAGAIGVFSEGYNTAIPRLKRAQVLQPSKCLMIADACARDGDPRAGGYAGTYSLSLDRLVPGVIGPRPSVAIAPRHGYRGDDCRTGRFGALFCDGSAEMIPYTDPRLSDPERIRQLTVPY